MTTNLTPGAVATPTAFPESGTFHTERRITLLCETRGARIHYTVDGSMPTVTSPVFDPYALPLCTVNDEGGHRATADFTIRALAVRDGMAPSDVATFRYTIARRGKDEYLNRALHPGLLMIVDFDDTKMVLVIGTKRALLIDAGLGAGDLRAYVESLANGLPLDVVITHAHPDHVACMGQFQEHSKVYMNHADMPMLKRFIAERGLQVDPEKVIDLKEGFSFNLGDRTLTVYEVPGHTSGSIVLFDAANGILFAGDALGSNRPTIVDALWMQNKGMLKIDEYLSSLHVFHAKLHGKIREIYTGHNDLPLLGETYLNNLKTAAQRLVDEGDAALVPSLRPTGVWQTVEGDRLSNPDWVSINVSKGSYLTSPPEKLATLSNLQVNGGTLDQSFKPDVLHYALTVGPDASQVEVTATSTSGRSSGLAINDVTVKSGVVQRVMLAGVDVVRVHVSSPDGSVTKAYTLAVQRTR
ncbi:MAG TPA: MBL fold metallo-hydrolase [Anaerolineae bacterium]